MAKDWQTRHTPAPRGHKGLTPQGSGKFTEHIWVGKKPPDKTQAFWYLSRQAKDLLYEKRQEGYFGGLPGKAPYWMVVEAGSAQAAVEPLWYIKRALDAWQGEVGAAVTQFFRAG